jgi:hypothetical protein
MHKLLQWFCPRKGIPSCARTRTREKASTERTPSLSIRIFLSGEDQDIEYGRFSRRDQCAEVFAQIFCGCGLGMIFH